MDKYHIIPQLTLEGNFGYRLESKEKIEAFAFVMPTKIVKGFPVFKGVRVAVEHELIHAFLNPLAEKYHNVINEHLKAFKPLEKILKRFGYSRALLIFNEHLVRACNIVIEKRYMGLPREDVAKLIKIEEKRGFKYIKTFYDAVEYYAVRKSKYENFEKFYPELLKIIRSKQ